MAMVIFLILPLSSNSAERDNTLPVQDSSTSFLHRLLPYKPNYLLPFYYMPPHNLSHINQDHLSKQAEIAFQISLKIHLWRLSATSTELYAAYTQQSYWKAYVDSAHFRGSDYSPEIFIDQAIYWGRQDGLQLTRIKLGAVHQSNGEGTKYERSWNRIYMEIGLKFKRWEVYIKPWYILKTPDLQRYNSDIQKFQGYGQVLIQYTYHQHQLSLTAYQKTLQFHYMFPLTPTLRGMIQVFNGYGPNLMFYKQRTLGVGVGFAFSH